MKVSTHPNSSHPKKNWGNILWIEEILHRLVDGNPKKYPGKRPRTVWGSGRILYDNVDDDDGGDDDDGDDDGDDDHDDDDADDADDADDDDDDDDVLPLGAQTESNMTI